MWSPCAPAGAVGLPLARAGALAWGCRWAAAGRVGRVTGPVNHTRASLSTPDVCDVCHIRVTFVTRVTCVTLASGAGCSTAHPRTLGTPNTARKPHHTHTRRDADPRV